ncbi:hypothetical protein Tco_0317052 [Tanacetum coccineum]
MRGYELTLTVSGNLIDSKGAGMDHKKHGFELQRSTMEENGSYGSKCTCTPSFSSSGLQGFNLSLDYCSWNLLGTS